MTEELPKIDSRRVPRWKPKSHSRVSCIPGKYGMGPSVALKLVDISELGAQLLVTTPLSIGSEVEIGLEAVGDPKPSRSAARVIWCEALPDGSHRAGVCFDKPLNYAFLQSLADF